MTEGHTLTAAPLRERTRLAVGDAQLRANLAHATDQFTARRGAAMASLEDPDGLREQARAAKADVLARLPEILDRLADNFLANGINVHWAPTAAAATEAVVGIAQRVGATRIVKSKSMLSEEIGLNHALEAAGCTVTETDLGEWIIQVARETPSHIIVPAIHKNRSQIAAALRTVADGDLSDVPEALAAFARAQLRRRFLEADMGVSGVNFAVAETGTLHIVSNEGNARLCTSVPRVHVAVMGMERVVETWDQLDVMLALLPRSATGQQITTYNSFISGPRAGGEADGPDEVHVVIVDNGRSDVLAGEMHEMLACIRCGACLNACPVYRQVGGHAYGWVYSGPMGAVLTPLLNHAPEAAEVADASSLCGACWQACPVAIPLQDMLLALRRRRVESEHKRAEQLAWSAWAATWSRPHRYRLSLRAGALGGRVLGVGVGRATLADRLPGPLRRWTATRTAPLPARRTFRDAWDGGIQ